jgi:NAD(P)-dependent dehydrogenase (short-subunit alcohol dehydrogenase family)
MGPLAMALDGVFGKHGKKFTVDELASEKVAHMPGRLDAVLAENPAREAAMTSSLPINRLGTPDEVAAAVVWLCSDAASFVTGHVMSVDGGWVAQ